MLFNSSVFLLLYLPVVLLGFFILATLKRPRLVGLWLTCASLFFYGWWNPLSLRCWAAWFLTTFWAAPCCASRGRMLLAFGVAANVLVARIFQICRLPGRDSADQSTGLEWAIPSIVLPLAISFFTFQQIAYLVDAHDGVAVEHDFLNYCLFVTFFPHLIAGPDHPSPGDVSAIRGPRPYSGPGLDAFSVGDTLFLIGLFKKVAIADTMELLRRRFSPPRQKASRSPCCGLERRAVLYAADLFRLLRLYRHGHRPGRSSASALPPNFNSPFKARNIIEFWSRWHMTLTRFLTAYIYNPLRAAR